MAKKLGYVLLLESGDPAVFPEKVGYLSDVSIVHRLIVTSGLR